MSERLIPWQPTTIAGPKQPLLLTPETAKHMIKKSKRPLFVVGPYVKEEPLINYVAKIADKWDLPIVTTADTYKAFSEMNIDSSPYGLVEIVNLLKNPNWNGINDEGQHDLVIFIGVIYYMGSQCLSTLKHFAPHLKTITLCKYFQFNTDASFPNMDDTEWYKYLEKMLI